MRQVYIFSPLFFLVTLFAMAGCAYVTTGPTQVVDVRFADPNASQTRCFFQNQHIKHEFIAPGSVRIQRTEDPMNLYCMSAGKRAYDVILNPRTSDDLWRNVYGAGLIGYYVDTFSRAAYVYPDHVVLDLDANDAAVFYVAPINSYDQQVAQDFRKRQAIAIERANRVFEGSQTQGNVSQFEIAPAPGIEDLFPALPAPDTQRTIVTEGDPEWDRYNRYLDGKPLNIRAPRSFNE